MRCSGGSPSDDDDDDDSHDDDDDSNTEELWGRVEGRMAHLEKIMKMCNSEHKLDLMKLFSCAERTGVHSGQMWLTTSLRRSRRATT